MRPTVLALLLIVVTTATVSAGDFNGFYAGVNAGYAFERGERTDAGAAVPPGTPDAESGLPPSALDAADRMTGRDNRARARSGPQR